MNMHNPIPVFLMPLLLIAALMGGCAQTRGVTGEPQYGEAGHTTGGPSDRYGSIYRLEDVQVDNDYKLGVGTAVGAVAGGIVGSKTGDSTSATVAGAVLGGLAGTYAQSKLGKNNAQRITVRMHSGGELVITQPTSYTSLRDGMEVRIEGSGENARVVPR